jgi:hypothetical protein
VTTPPDADSREDARRVGPGDDGESQQERLNRQLGELLQEIRVAMPGVQILFAFLLAVPFNQRFGDTTDFQVKVYLFALVCSAFASAFFIAPTAYHRIMFQQRDKPNLIRTASRLAIVGLGALALAMSGAVLLVTDFLFSPATAVIVTAVVLLTFAWLWFGLATSRRLLGKRSH